VSGDASLIHRALAARVIERWRLRHPDREVDPAWLKQEALALVREQLQLDPDPRSLPPMQPRQDAISRQ
jgi:hypothetical protein